MPRKRVPLAVAELRGTTKRHPRPPELSNPNGIGDPPAHLTPAERALWEEIVREAVPGLLTEGDRKVLEQLAVVYASFRQAQADGRAAQFKPADHSLIVKLLGQLGMTPAERIRLPRQGPAEGNPFNEF